MWLMASVLVPLQNICIKGKHLKLMNKVLKLMNKVTIKSEYSNVYIAIFYLEKQFLTNSTACDYMHSTLCKAGFYTKYLTSHVIP